MSETRLSILGSTGSIGCQTLDVVRRNPGRFSVSVLAANRNTRLIAEQIREFSPEFVAISDDAAYKELKKELGSSVKLSSGEEALSEAACYPGSDVVVVALVGFCALKPVLSAIEKDKRIALANKECLVAGGELIGKALARSRARIVPVDSEHNSIFQCLLAQGADDKIRRIVLTASGGPFLFLDMEHFKAVTPAQAVSHPRWNMGAKISVDSATLMNKGLEVIEASRLFELSGEKIEVLVHPQSLLHGLVEFYDGTMLAALYEPDMRVPISATLGYLSGNGLRGPRTVESGAILLDLAGRERLEFFKPDYIKFPLLRLSYEALEVGGSATTVLNAANEVCVMAFLNDSAGFTDIPVVVEKTLACHRAVAIESIDDVLEADRWARARAASLLGGMRGLEQGLSRS